MYRSPLHILSDLENDFSSIDEPDFLLRLRKKILAEFNLTNTPEITINSKPFTKDEVIKTIDILMENPQMPMHVFIFSNKELLDFLENDFSKTEAERVSEIAIPGALKEMLSPILLERYSFFLKKAFNTRNFGSAKNIISIHPNLEEKERTVFFDALYKQLLQITQQLIEQIKNNCVTILTETEYLTRLTFSAFLNNLPADFLPSVNKLVSAIINLMVAYQGISGYRKSYLFEVSTNLCTIKCEERLMNLIRKNHVILTGLHEKELEENRPKDPYAARKGIALAVLILLLFFGSIFLAFLGGSGNTNDSRQLSNEEASPQTYATQFWLYRTAQLNDDIRDGQSNLPFFLPVKIDHSLSAKNPFRHILKRNTEEEHKDTSLLKVIVENETSYDLILTTHHAETAEAFYFLRNYPDTLFLHKLDKLSLYFGNDPGYNKVIPPFDTSLNKSFELYFGQTTIKTSSVFKKNYKLRIQKNETKEVLPVLKFTDDFFKTDSFSSPELHLYETNDY